MQEEVFDYLVNNKHIITTKIRIDTMWLDSDQLFAGTRKDYEEQLLTNLRLYLGNHFTNYEELCTIVDKNFVINTLGKEFFV